jgi:hypothetical protein
MPRARRVFKSTITEHVDRARIERDLALGRPLRIIARKYGLPSLLRGDTRRNFRPN